jgi:enoyl-CoA hydratase/carnithine racemase
MAFTGSAISSEKALKFGLVNEVYDTKEELLKNARDIAKLISFNSPLVVQGTKISLNYADEHTTKDSLNQIALWNSAFLQSNDLVEAFTSFIEKRKPKFKSKL